VTDDEEAQLIAAARAGDMRAFGKLVDAHQIAVRGFLRRLMRSTGDAEDVAQEAFVRAFDALARFDGRARFRTFVCGIAYRVWRDQNRAWFRARTRESAYSEAITAGAGVDADLKLALRQAMETLPEAQRAAVALCLGAEFSHEEAAAALQLPLGTVKSHVARGRARLRQVLGDDDGGQNDDA
jgi:RNA polymerase sigma-70 factor (ECF subfamily)